MAKKITGQDLFDVGSFNEATGQIVQLIKSITDEIGKAKQASGQLSAELGKSLKAEIEKITSTSKNLEQELAKVTKKFNDLKTTVTTSNDVIKKYESENKKLETQLKKVQEGLKKLGKEQTTTNKTQKDGGVSAKGLTQSLIGVASGAALVYKGIVLLKDQLILAVKSTMEFETAMKEVQAISRASSKELEALTENANRLGATTEKTATQIATLQKELGKLGFNTTEILASTDAIVDLSTATGEDLASSATIAAATLRAFGLEAIEMGRVVDTMAGSFVRSGLDLEKFRESMKLVAPIARAANIDLETTTAALSKLADAGLSGSLAGTALRNLFSNMADPTSKLSKQLGFAVTNSDDLIVAFKKLRDEGIGLAEAVQLVDVRARPAFFTLLNQVDAVEQLSLEYKILDGEANDIAETMRDTLANDVAIANSAFDALRRNIVEEFVPALRSAVQFTAELSEGLRFVVKGLSNLGSASKKAAEDTETMAYLLIEVAKAIATLPFYVMKTSNAFDRAAESVEGTTEAIDRSRESIKGIYSSLHQLEGIKALSDGINKGVLDAKNWENITGYQKILGDEFKLIFDQLERGTINHKEATTLVQGQLEKKLKTEKDIYEQHQLTIESLETEIRQKQKLADAEGKGNVYDTLNIEIGALRERKELIYNYLNDTSSHYTLLKKLFKDTEGSAGNLNKELEGTKQKLSDIVLLELERQKVRSQGREQELAAQLKEVDEGVLTTFKKKELLKELTQERIRLSELALEKELRNIDKSEDGTTQTLVRQQTAYEKYFNEISKIRRDSFIEAKNINNAEEGIFKDMIQANIEAAKAGQKKWGDLTLAEQKKLLDEVEEDIEDWGENVADIIANSMQYVSKMTTEIFNNGQIRRENELRSIDNWEQKRIELAGDNAEAIEAIEKEAEKKRNEVRKRQAKADKKEAIFQIAINTAAGIAKAFPDFITMGVIAALGIAQAAVVANRPLPEFYKGTDNSPEGLAVVGDRYGRELIQDGKTGEYRVTPDKSTVQYLSEGSKVFTNKETERILSSVDHNGIAVSKLSGANQSQRQAPIDYNKLGKTFEDAVTKIPVSTTNFDQNGVRTFVTKGRNRTERLNNRYKY